jgi:aspartyl-tRNA(Asn)/glutamyl-tRNA(Gln) amidotransferase subunit B
LTIDHLNYEPIIGLEVHAQMKTKSKAFCSCSTEFNTPPNTNVCPVCLGHPGTLPVLNKDLVEFILRLGIATECQITERSIFARKNYFYPDLPKGYQISQYDRPVCHDGWLEINYNEILKRIGITRIHMEEDAGKSLHDVSPGETLVDLNRCGVPLIEIVSEPDIRSAEEAKLYLQKLKQLVQYLDICDANMEEGSLRCDANVSVRKKDATGFGTKTEIKNLNSFKNLVDALEYEIKRQVEIIDGGGKVIHQTLAFDAARKVTYPMRSKEEAHDYRYFPEPDLVRVYVSEKWKESVRKNLPEFPDKRILRFIEQYSLPRYDAEVLVQDKDVADYFERVCAGLAKPPLGRGAEGGVGNDNFKAASNWIMTGVMRVLNEQKIGIRNFWVKEENIASLIKLIDDKIISNNIAKEVFAEMLKLKDPTDEAQKPEVIVKEKNLAQVTDESEIEAVIKKIISDNPKEAERFRSGETKLAGFFVGKVMRETKGKANPQKVNELLWKIL